MGDVGSLALGGAIGTVAVIIKQELLLPFIGGIFVIEAVSVILQVASYKLRKKRIFKMAPLHHHFELLGWSESKIIVRFWIAISRVCPVRTDHTKAKMKAAGCWLLAPGSWLLATIFWRKASGRKRDAEMRGASSQ